MFLAVGCVATGVAVNKMGATVKNRQQLSRRAWLFAILICVMSYISVDQVEIYINTQIAPNIAWLMRYWLTILAFYSTIHVGYFLNKRSEPAWISFFTLSNIAALTIIYLSSIRHLPYYADNSQAQTMSMLVFMCVAYICLGTLAFINVLQFGKLALQETDQVTTVRWLAPTLSASCGTAFFIINFSYLIVEYIGLVQHTTSVTAVVRTLFVTAMLVWPVFFLPRSVIAYALKVFNNVEKIIILSRLNRLQRNLNQVSTRIALSEKHWVKKLRSLDLQIYRAIIAILDGKRIIEYYLSLEIGKDHIFLNNEEMLMTHHLKVRAQELHDLLSPVDDHQDFDQLVSSYSQIGKGL